MNYFFANLIKKMMNSLKRYLKYRFTKLYRFASNKIENLKIKDNSKTLIYIHIGKCGGVTLVNALKKSSFIQNKFSSVHRVHFRRPPIKKMSHTQLLFVIQLKEQYLHLIGDINL